jgi:hypothetical protein
MAATRPSILVPFKQGYGEVPRPIPRSVMARSLAASTAEDITPPAGSRYVIFSCTGDFYVNPYATATVPGDTTDGTAAELNPAGYEFNTNELPTFSVISSGACVITAAFYS